MHNPNTTGNAIRVIAAITLAFIGIFGLVQLLRDQLISEVSFILLVSLCCIVGLFIGFVERIKILSLKDMKVTLHKIETARNDVRELALAVADLVESSLSESLVTEAFDDAKFQDALNKVRDLK